MQIEVGAVLEGKITSITNFGAFVSLPEGKTGMVHISEVSSSYVKDIHDFLKEGQQVSVKVISVDTTVSGTKIGLSIKRAAENTATVSEGNAAQSDKTNFQRNRIKQSEYSQPKPKYQHQSSPAKVGSNNPPDYIPAQNFQKHSGTGDPFEDMMNKFKANSDEKMSDLRKATDAKRSSPGFTRKNNNKY